MMKKYQTRISCACLRNFSRLMELAMRKRQKKGSNERTLLALKGWKKPAGRKMISEKLWHTLLCENVSQKFWRRGNSFKHKTILHKTLLSKFEISMKERWKHVESQTVWQLKLSSPKSLIEKQLYRSPLKAKAKESTHCQVFCEKINFSESRQIFFEREGDPIWDSETRKLSGGCREGQIIVLLEIKFTSTMILKEIGKMLVK